MQQITADNQGDTGHLDPNRLDTFSPGRLKSHDSFYSILIGVGSIIYLSSWIQTHIIEAEKRTGSLIHLDLLF